MKIQEKMKIGHIHKLRGGEKGRKQKEREQENNRKMDNDAEEGKGNRWKRRKRGQRTYTQT